jgi:hypothetical protein
MKTPPPERLGKFAPGKAAKAGGKPMPMGKPKPGKKAPAGKKAAAMAPGLINTQASQF